MDKWRFNLLAGPYLKDGAVVFSSSVGGRKLFFSYHLVRFLCHFQVKLSEKSSLLDTAESKIAELTEKVVEQQKLIQKLEEDILKVSIFGWQRFLLWFI